MCKAYKTCILHRMYVYMCITYVTCILYSIRTKILKVYSCIVYSVFSCIRQNPENRISSNNKPSVPTKHLKPSKLTQW